ncbi:hypothetical protein FQA39_LY10657 [Lamprigera yunnana]|nr:hypothetical protein FQA39_LY10657 [Lamprigera yunnana]
MELEESNGCAKGSDKRDTITDIRKLKELKTGQTKQEDNSVKSLRNNKGLDKSKSKRYLKIGTWNSRTPTGKEKEPDKRDTITDIRKLKELKTGQTKQEDNSVKSLRNNKGLDKSKSKRYLKIGTWNSRTPTGKEKEPVQ